jgi:hypothetical protein
MDTDDGVVKMVNETGDPAVAILVDVATETAKVIGRVGK